MKFNPAA